MENLDKEKLESITNVTSENSEYFFQLVNNIVTMYTKDLDAIMKDLYRDTTNSDAITTDEVERYYAELTNMLYFMTTNVERLNVFSDMAIAAAKEVYSKAYLDAAAEKDEKGKSLRTVGENQSVAEIASQYENVSSSIYQHAYRCIKAKYDAALETVSMLKNIIKRRMNEEYLSGVAGANVPKEPLQ